MTTSTDKPRKPRAVVRHGSRAGQDAIRGRVTKVMQADKPVAEDTMPALLQCWGDELSTGELGLLHAVVMDFRAGGGARVGVPFVSYARRLGVTAADVERHLDRLAAAGALEVLERLRGALIVRPVPRLSSADFGRAASRLRRPRLIRHRTRSIQPAPAA